MQPIIRGTLEATAGVRSADLTFSGKTANIRIDENTVQPASLIKKIRDLGYKVTDQPQRQQRGA